MHGRMFKRSTKSAPTVRIPKRTSCNSKLDLPTSQRLSSTSVAALLADIDGENDCSSCQHGCLFYELLLVFGLKISFVLYSCNYELAI